MKRFLFVLIIAFCLVPGLCSLSGCSDTPPIEFCSVLDINTDESGTRTITATASKSTLNSLFGNKNTSFQSFITANCPDIMEWSYVETGSSYELTFVIGFQSLEEYQSKISELTGVSGSVAVTRPQVGVKTGFTLTESTDTMSLFSWLTSALAQRTGVSRSKLSSLLLNGSSQLIYAGIDHPQTGPGLYVYVETLLDAEYIDVLTDLSLDNAWNRTIRIHFPSAILDNASNVKPYLTSLLPDGITEAWQDDTTWVLTFPVCSLEELGGLMSGLFQSKEPGLLTEEISARTAQCFIHTYKETLNIAFFVPNTGQTTVRYYVKNAADVRLSTSGKEDEELADAVSLNGDYPDYTCLYSQNISEGSFHFTAVYQYQPSEIRVDTAILSSQDIRRTITLDFGSQVSAVHRELMLDAFRNTAGNHGYISGSDETGSYCIQYRQAGTVSDINEGFTAVFGGSSSFSYHMEQASLLDRHQKSACSDEADFRSFLTDPAKTVINYQLTFPEGESLSDGSHTLTFLSADGTYQITGSAARTNYLRYCLFALDILVGLFLFYLFLTGPVRSYIGYRRQQKRNGTGKKSSAAHKRGGKRPR